MINALGAIARVISVLMLILQAGCGGGGSNGGNGGNNNTVSVAGAALIVVFKGDVLQVYDQTQPKSSTNPLTLDTGVSDDFDQWLLVSIEDIDPVTGLRSRLRTPRMVYLKQGRLYRVNLMRGADHTPVRISSLEDICGLAYMDVDYRAVDSSWVKVSREQDGGCSKAWLLRLGASANDGGRELEASVDFQLPLFDAGRGLTGYLVSSNHSLYRVDSSLENPMLISGSSYIERCQAGVADQVRAYLSCSDDQEWTFIYRYTIATGSLTSVDFVIGALVSSGAPMLMDANSVYFFTTDYTSGESSTLMAIAHNAASARSLTGTLAGYPTLDTQTNARLLFVLSDNTSYTYYSVAKNSNAATPTKLYDAGESYPVLISAHENGLLHANLLDFLGTGTSARALRMNENGSNTVLFENTSWGGGNRSGSYRPDGGGFTPFSNILQFTETTTGVHADVVDPATGSTLRPLADFAGTRLNPRGSNPSSGLDRFVSIRRLLSRTAGAPPQTYLVDTQQAANVQTLDGVGWGGGGNPD